MPSTTDATLREIATSATIEAERLLAMPGLAVVGADFWSDIADRLRRAIDRVSPTRLGAQAGRKIREAARAGMDRLSEASGGVREQLRTIESRALLAMAMPILMPLAVLLIIEKSGVRKRVQTAGREYVRARYGF